MIRLRRSRAEEQSDIDVYPKDEKYHYLSPRGSPLLINTTQSQEIRLRHSRSDERDDVSPTPLDEKYHSFQARESPRGSPLTINTTQDEDNSKMMRPRHSRAGEQNDLAAILDEKYHSFKASVLLPFLRFLDEKYHSFKAPVLLPFLRFRTMKIVGLFFTVYALMTFHLVMHDEGGRMMVGNRNNVQNDVELSVVILTYKKTKALANLLPSVLNQRPSNFEIILVDNGCLDETKNLIDKTLGGQTTVPHKYLRLCDNPGYAAGNNAGVKLASVSSTQILLLNDDIVLSKPDFIQNMIKLAQFKEKSGAVGCKLLNADGSELIEAGSTIFKDASAAGLGRGRKDVNAPEFSYPKPVDYVSGACLLVNREVFEDYGGFDGDHFPNYYEDTDLQLHIQHDVRREVWLQPKSVALHDEHGSFGNAESEKLMQVAAKKFASKWSHQLSANHATNPYYLDEKDQGKEWFRASDLRARDPRKANILFLEEKSPNKSRGGGFGRSFDNLSMIAGLGHRVTLVTWLPRDAEKWCDDACVDEITALGVEYVTTGEWDELVQSRIGYYDVVIVSRPSTLKATYERWQDFYRQSSFSLVYDSEALWYRRDEILHNLVQKEHIDFPGYERLKPKVMEALINETKRTELTLLKMPDTVITVCEGEQNLIKTLLPDADINVKIIGHVMDSGKKTERKFSERKGILFLASFVKSMYYNGDAIWYFLKYVYPSVVKGSTTSHPIPLTIAGRGIPSELRELVEKNANIAKYVTFLDSPPTIDHLYEENRVFIAPHLYGSGIQFKVSEALAAGLPVVMSKFTKDSFGTVPGCVGSNDASFAKCVIDLHNDEHQWEAVRDEGISFIERTHGRQKIMEVWSEIIEDSFKNASKKQVQPKLLGTKLPSPTEACAEGEEFYIGAYEDVANAVQAGVFKTGFDHWIGSGKAEGRTYFCNDGSKNTSKTQVGTNPSDAMLSSPTQACPEGETLYLNAHEDVATAVKNGVFKNGFDHWILDGKAEGRSYFCKLASQ